MYMYVLQQSLCTTEDTLLIFYLFYKQKEQVNSTMGFQTQEWKETKQ